MSIEQAIKQLQTIEKLLEQGFYGSASLAVSPVISFLQSLAQPEKVDCKNTDCHAYGIRDINPGCQACKSEVSE